MKEIRRITLTVTRRQTVRQQWLPVSAICSACGCKVELQVEMPNAQAQAAFSSPEEMGSGQAASSTALTLCSTRKTGSESQKRVSQMSWKKYLQRGSSAALICLTGWLWLGIYQDREFGENYLFLKHWPTLKFYFRAPLGESDRTLKELAPEQRAEEMLFQAYVEKGGGNRRCLRLSIR